VAEQLQASAAKLGISPDAALEKLAHMRAAAKLIPKSAAALAQSSRPALDERKLDGEAVSAQVGSVFSQHMFLSYWCTGIIPSRSSCS
jgi:hypothetical protein